MEPEEFEHQENPEQIDSYLPNFESFDSTPVSSMTNEQLMHCGIPYLWKMDGSETIDNRVDVWQWEEEKHFNCDWYVVSFIYSINQVSLFNILLFNICCLMCCVQST